MPLLGKKLEHDLVPPPPDLDPNEPVFVIRFTHEIFRDYDVYLRTLHFYRQRQWMCRYTGRDGYTYEEALLSEEASTGKVSDFPACFEEHVLRRVHHSAAQRVEELVARIHNHYKLNFVPGEECMAVGPNGAPLPCVVVSAPLLERNTFDRDTYEVRWLYNAAEPPTAFVAPNQLSRFKHPLPRALLKAWIMHAATMQTFGKFTVWVARPNYVTKYDLPTELPMEMAAAKAAAKASSGRGRGRGRGLGRGAGGAAAAAAFLNPGLYGPNGEGLSGRSAHAYAALAGYVANPHVGGSHVPQIGINANNADMETARARFKPGAIKHQLFHLLEEAGPSGLKVQQIIDLMQERGLKDWSTISVPRNTVTTACSGDAAFVRVAPATFALRAFHPDLVEEIPERRGPLPHAVQAALAAARPTEKMTEEQLQSTSMSEAVLEAAAKFGSGSGGTMVNSDRCTECRRKRDVADTVLVLCDKCPRAFHLGCLRMTEDQLPTGDWKCPRCVEKEAYVQQRYREILHLKRLLEADPFGALKMAKLRAANEHGHTAEDRRRVFDERERMRLEDKARRDAADAMRRRLNRYPIDDNELMEEDAEDAAIHGRAPHPDVPPPPRPLVPVGATAEQAAQASQLLDMLTLCEFFTHLGPSLPEPMMPLTVRELKEALETMDPAVLAALYVPLLRALVPERSRINNLLTPATWASVAARYFARFAQKRGAKDGGGGGGARRASTGKDGADDGDLPMTNDGGGGAASAQIAEDLMEAAQVLGTPSGGAALDVATHLKLLQLLVDEVLATDAMAALLDRNFLDVEELQKQQRMQKETDRREAKAAEEAEKEKRKADRVAGADAKRQRLQAMTYGAEAPSVQEEADEANEEMPNFDINPALEEYTGDPNDPQALAAHKKMVDGVKARLERKREEWEKQHTATKRQRAAKVAAQTQQAEREEREEREAKENAVLQAAEDKELRHQQLKAAIKARQYRAPSLGLDRYSRQYFWFHTRKTEILIHDLNTGNWGVLDTKLQLDKLLASLNVKGVREKGLHERVTQLYDKICTAFAVRQSGAAAQGVQVDVGTTAAAVAAVEAQPSATEQRDTYEREVLMTTANDLRTMVNETAACCANVEGGWDAWDTALGAAAAALDYSGVMTSALQLEAGIAELVGLKLVVKPKAPSKADAVHASPALALATRTPTLAPSAAPMEPPAVHSAVEGDGAAPMEVDGSMAPSAGPVTPVTAAAAAAACAPSPGEEAKKPAEKPTKKLNAGVPYEWADSREYMVDGRLHITNKMWENAAQRKLWREEAEAVGRSGSATNVAWHARMLVVRSKSSLKAFSKHNAEEVTNAQKRQFAMGHAATPFRNAKMRLRTDDQEDDALWDSLCFVCGSDGDVLCCEGKVLGGQGCSNVAHLACCGLSRMPRGSWFCADCRNRRELEGVAGTPAQRPNPSPTPRIFKVKL